MTKVTFKGQETKIRGHFPKPGDTAPNFTLVNQQLETVTLASFKGKKKVIATVISMDTPVCKVESKKINEFAASHRDTIILLISKDLPFRQKAICGAENMDNIITLSDIRPDSTFGKSYGVLIEDGPLAGLLARSVICLDAEDKITYAELVPEITKEPNLEELFATL